MFSGMFCGMCVCVCVLFTVENVILMEQIGEDTTMSSIWPEKMRNSRRKVADIGVHLSSSLWWMMAHSSSAIRVSVCMYVCVCVPVCLCVCNDCHQSLTDDNPFVYIPLSVTINLAGHRIETWNKDWTTQSTTTTKNSSNSNNNNKKRDKES